MLCYKHKIVDGNFYNIILFFSSFFHVILGSISPIPCDMILLKEHDDKLPKCGLFLLNGSNMTCQQVDCTENHASLCQGITHESK